MSLDGYSLSLDYFDVTGTRLIAYPTQTGRYFAVATFPGSTNYTGTVSQPFAFNVNSPSGSPPTLSLNAAGGSYDGSPFLATATVAGTTGGPQAWLENTTTAVTYYDATGILLTAAPTQAGTYFAVASFAGSAHYAAYSTAAPLTITAATPIVSITDDGGTYSGTSYPATVQVAGVNGVSTTTPDKVEGVQAESSYFDSQGNEFTSAPTDAGTYTVVTTFAGSANHVPATTSSTFTIAQAIPTITSPATTATYDGFAHGANATAVGVNSSDLVITYGNGSTAPTSTAPTSAGNYTVTASYPGSKDYAPASTTANLTINAPSSAAGSTPAIAGSANASAGAASASTINYQPAAPSGSPGFTDTSSYVPVFATVSGVGTLPSQSALLTPTSSTSSTSQGGQYAMPGQAGLVAPTGALAATVNDPTQSGVAQAPVGVPYILTAGGYPPNSDYATPGMGVAPGIYGSTALLLSGSDPVYNTANIAPLGSYLGLLENAPQGTLTYNPSPPGPQTITNSDGSYSVTVDNPIWSGIWNLSTPSVDLGNDSSGRDQTASGRIESANITYQDTTTVSNYDAQGRPQKVTTTVVSTNATYYSETTVGHLSCSFPGIESFSNNISHEKVMSTLSVSSMTYNQNPAIVTVDTSSNNYSLDTLYYDPVDHPNNPNPPLNPEVYQEAVTSTHKKTVTGAAQASSPGTHGQEAYTYTEQRSDQDTYTEGDNLINNNVTKNYSGQVSNSTSWIDNGNRTVIQNSNSGQDNTVNDTFSATAGTNQAYTIQEAINMIGATGNTTTTKTIVNNQTSNSSVFDYGSGTFVQFTAVGLRPGLLTGSETFSNGQTFGLTENDSLTSVDINGVHPFYSNVNCTQAYTGSATSSDLGTVITKALTSSSQAGNSDKFDTEGSLSQTLTNTLTGNSDQLNLISVAGGTQTVSQDDQGSDSFSDATGLGPTLQLGLGSLGGASGQALAGLLSSNTMSEKDSGSGTFKSHQSKTRTYTASQNLQGGNVAPAWTTNQFNLNLTTTQSYTDSTTGVATVTDTGTNNSKNSDSISENYGITEAGTDKSNYLYSGAQLAVNESASDNYVANDGGTSADETVVTDPLEAGGIPNPNPGNAAASDSLLAQFGSEDIVSNGNFTDKVGGSETGNLTRQWNYKPAGWASGGVNFNVTTNGTFGLKDGGNDTINLTGSMAPDTISDNVNQTDNGSGGSTYALSSGDGVNFALATTGKVKDNYRENDNGNANLSLTVNPNSIVGGTPAGTGTHLSDQLTGSDNFTENLNAQDGFNVGADYLLQGAVWVLQNMQRVFDRQRQLRRDGCRQRLGCRIGRWRAE